MPARNTFFLPWMSASLPSGTRNIAAARRYAVEIQLKVIASAENSLPIEGMAILMEVPMKGVRKEAVAATNRTTRLSTAVLTCVPSVCIRRSRIPAGQAPAALRS
jgi:hypothetical protein